MALSSAYTAILSDLNRDIARAQPNDPLQFCSNWFQQRLEAERATSRGAQAANHLNMSGVGTNLHERKQTPPSSSMQTYSFGDTRSDESTSTKSPFGDYTVAQQQQQQTNNPASPFSSRSSVERSTSGSGSGGPASPNGGGLPRSTSHPAPLSFGGPLSQPTSPPSRNSQLPTQSSLTSHRNSQASNDDSDEEVEDPRDDPNFHPKPGQSLFGSTTTATGSSLGGNNNNIPSTYNLGRRTSVSAESLDPNANTTNLPKTVIAKSDSQRERIETSIANNLLFRNLDEDQHVDVLNAMKEVTVDKGTEVIVQGAVGDFFYVVESGSFEAWVRAPPTHQYLGPGQTVSIPGEEKKVATYGPGGSFGELALMYNAPRAATVVATSRSVLWALDRVTFRSILMEHTSRKRKMYEAFLAEVPILTSLNDRERSKIADALEEKVYEQGENVVVEGEVGKNFYIIESGQAEVLRRRKSSGPGFDDEVLGTLSKGDYFGELALLNSAPRAATVRAMPGQGRLRVATLGEKAFTRLLGPVIDILQRKAETSYGQGPKADSILNQAPAIKA
ncbi:hypothetical protein OIO90_005989 [Microbotryomycetes sp. JL221]|nr:hypothetical protein OIO90_005989 [Microbotryomycetes sp. JL221]